MRRPLAAPVLAAPVLAALAACSAPASLDELRPSACARREPPPREAWYAPPHSDGYPFRIQVGESPDERVGLMAADGRVIVPPIYDLAQAPDPFPAHAPLVLVWCEDGKGYADMDGREVIPARFYDLYPQEDGTIRATYDPGWGPFRRLYVGVLSREGEIVEPFTPEDG